MARYPVLVLGIAASIAATAATAAAQGKVVDELRLGALAHDAGIFGNNKEPGADLNAELRFVSPEFLRVIGAPRPPLGVSVNTSGATDQAYFGLTWTLTLLRGLFSSSDNLFLDGSLGGSVHDGELDTSRVDRKSLGSRFLFRESLELGWSFIPSQSISVMLDHISNAGLARRNQGLDTIGMRYGIRF